MKYTYKVSLDVKQLNELAENLQKYASRVLPNRLEEYVSKLADVGIRVARNHTTRLYDIGEVSDLISFEKELDPNVYECTAIVVMSDIHTITSEWNRHGKNVSAEVSPTLMSEFGSGNYAVEGNRGKFPNQTHAFEPSWSWKDKEGQWHSSKGIKPTRPMYNAMMQIYNEANDVAREVFGNG